ncbi:MAG: acylphosphatase [Nocardioidaceae bacterium]|nr:acylphosphatase [Nocardioidaceae bacterium]
MKAVEVRVTGQVQGVGFRMNTVQQARHEGVTGWVRNEPDESVAARFEGEDAAVDAMVVWCRQGPDWARVQAVDVNDVEPIGSTSFEIRY